MGKIFKSLVVLTSKFVMVAVVDSNHLVSMYYVVATGIQLATLEGVSLPGPLGWPLIPGSRLQ